MFPVTLAELRGKQHEGLALDLGCHGSSLPVTGDRNPEAWQFRHAVSEVSCGGDGHSSVTWC